MKIKKKGFMFSIENLTEDDIADLFFILHDVSEACEAEDPNGEWISTAWLKKLTAEIKRLKLFGIE